MTQLLSDINRRTGKVAWLLKPAAGGYERIKNVGAPGGCLSDAGRSNAEQRKLFEDWVKSGRKNPPSVARPGTSLHETGLAIDAAEPLRSWLRKYGKYYGWVNPAWAKRSNTFEPWHWEHVASKDRSKHVKIKIRPELTAGTYRAVSRAIGRKRINRPSTASGQIKFWKQVQREINRTMRREKNWTPLRVDGIDGPATWHGLRLSLRKTNKPPFRPGKKASQARTIRTWQRGLNRGWWGRTIAQING